MDQQDAATLATDTAPVATDPAATTADDSSAGPSAPSGSPAAALDGLLADLAAVDAALAHLDDGTYGLCATCRTPIDDARLSEIPTAARCRACDQGAAPPSP